MNTDVSNNKIFSDDSAYKEISLLKWLMGSNTSQVVYIFARRSTLNKKVKFEIIDVLRAYNKVGNLKMIFVLFWFCNIFSPYSSIIHYYISGYLSISTSIGHTMCSDCEPPTLINNITNIVLGHIPPAIVNNIPNIIMGHLTLIQSLLRRHNFLVIH